MFEGAKRSNPHAIKTLDLADALLLRRADDSHELDLLDVGEARPATSAHRVHDVRRGRAIHQHLGRGAATARTQILQQTILDTPSTSDSISDNTSSSSLGVELDVAADAGQLISQLRCVCERGKSEQTPSICGNTASRKKSNGN